MYCFKGNICGGQKQVEIDDEEVDTMNEQSIGEKRASDQEKVDVSINQEKVDLSINPFNQEKVNTSINRFNHDEPAATLVEKAAKVHKQQTNKVLSAWNILKRQASIDHVTQPEKRQYGSVAGLVSPRLSLDSERRIWRIRKEHRHASTESPHSERQARGRMSIVAKEWDDVRKVIDPESDVGGVYVGDGEGEEGRERAGVRQIKDAFAAIKISDHKLSMIDDEA